MSDRVSERRRAAALARHYRDQEHLTIAEIARRLGRAEATVKAYLFDPSNANKRPTDTPRGQRKTRRSAAQPHGRSLPALELTTARYTRAYQSQHQRGNSSPDGSFLRLGWLSSTSGRLRFVCSTVSRNGAVRRNSPATTETRRVCRSRRSLVGWDAQRQPLRRISTIRPAIRHARSRRATGECVAAAGRPPRRGTARATPTRIANAAIPARLRRNGRGNGFAKRCAHGERATALRRRPTTGRARTRAGVAAKRSNDYRSENGPRRPLSPICTEPGRRPSPTPSAAPERSGVNAVDIRTRAGARPPVCERERRRWSPRRFCHCVRREARRREPAVVCQQPFVVRRPKFRDGRRSRPRGRRDYRNQWRSHREHRAPPDARPVAKELVSSATGRDHIGRQRHQSPTAASRQIATVRRRRVGPPDQRHRSRPAATNETTAGGREQHRSVGSTDGCSADPVVKARRWSLAERRGVEAEQARRRRARYRFARPSAGRCRPTPTAWRSWPRPTSATSGECSSPAPPTTLLALVHRGCVARSGADFCFQRAGVTRLDRPRLTRRLTLALVRAGEAAGLMPTSSETPAVRPTSSVDRDLRRERNRHPRDALASATARAAGGTAGSP